MVGSLKIIDPQEVIPEVLLCNHLYSQVLGFLKGLDGRVLGTDGRAIGFKAKPRVGEKASPDGLLHGLARMEAGSGEGLLQTRPQLGEEDSGRCASADLLQSRADDGIHGDESMREGWERGGGGLGF